MNEKQSTRDKILDAVFALVYINGFNGTSMSMILKECNIPKGSLYHHFKSKKEMVLAVVRERLSPRMDEFYKLQQKDNEHGIDTIIFNILKASQKEDILMNGCPLNRLNQEMSPVDKDFEFEINIIYEKIKIKIKSLLDNSSLIDGIESGSLSEFIIASVWGSLSLSPKQSSKIRYLASTQHLVNYLKSVKV